MIEVLEHYIEDTQHERRELHHHDDLNNGQEPGGADVLEHAKVGVELGEEQCGESWTLFSDPFAENLVAVPIQM